ncbi:MAG: PQQ-binding-like beta-propeller repeat protein [Bauldia sp.]
MSWLRKSILGVVGLACAAGPSPLAAQSAKGVVDDRRLAAAATDIQNWVTFGHDYSNQRFSGLAQIDRATVRRLAPAWIYQLGTVASTQAQPLVVDGVMYFPAPNDDIVAVNAATGEEIWRYRHRFISPRPAPGSRGVAVGYGKVFEGTDDRRVVAVDQGTGRLIWDRSIDGYQAPAALAQPNKPRGPANFSFRYPPQVYSGLVILSTTLNSGPITDLEQFVKDEIAVGADAGADWLNANLGVRGFTVALDANSGNEVWRFYMTPESGWEGNYGNVAANGVVLVDRAIDAERRMAAIYRNSWASSGVATAWAPAIDVASGALFLPTGNPGIPFDLARPGDNLYSNSIVSLDGKTGRLRWYFQTVPHGGDYDLISQTMLFDTLVNGQTVQAVGDGGKDGFYYALDRNSGKLAFASPPLVPASNTYRYPTRGGILHEPGEPGGVSVSPHSYDASTGIAYIAEIHRPTTYRAVELPPYQGRPALSYPVLTTAPPSQAYGLLTAIDLRNGGRIVWQTKTPQPLVGGVVATAGGLVFAGEANGAFNAYDSRTGANLWSFQTGANVGASAVSYAVDGRQYVAVMSGAAAPPDGTPLAPGGLRPGGAVIAFAVMR